VGRNHATSRKCDIGFCREDKSCKCVRSGKFRCLMSSGLVDSGGGSSSSGDFILQKKEFVLK
jgi:hypothetical protein